MCLDAVEVDGVGAFEFDDAVYIPKIVEDGAVGFFRIGGVFLFGFEVVARLWFEGVAENFDEEVLEKPVLVFLLLHAEDGVLHAAIAKVCLEAVVGFFAGVPVDSVEVFAKDRSLKGARHNRISNWGYGCKLRQKCRLPLSEAVAFWYDANAPASESRRRARWSARPAVLRVGSCAPKPLGYCFMLNLDLLLRTLAITRTFDSREMMKKNLAYTRALKLVEDQQDEMCLLLREDFDSCGPEQDVDAAIEKLIDLGKLAKLREDAYAFLETSSISGKPVLRCGLQALAIEYAERKGANIQNTVAQTLYASGASKQVPNSRFVGVDRPIEGSLTFRQRSVSYECV